MRRLIIALVLIMSTPLLLAAGGGSLPSGGGAAPVVQTPEQRATRLYNAGLKYRKKAWKYEEKAAAATSEKKRSKYLKRAETQYKRVLKNQNNAIKQVGGFYQAMSELGYAYRKLGDYEKAIAAYNTALSLKGDYSEAIEYRGEAYLALGAFEKTKQAYMTLFRQDPEKAALLMQAFELWSHKPASQKADAEAFLNWIAERKLLVSVSSHLSHSNPGDW